MSLKKSNLQFLLDTIKRVWFKNNLSVKDVSNISGVSENFIIFLLNQDVDLVDNLSRLIEVSGISIYIREISQMKIYRNHVRKNGDAYVYRIPYPKCSMKYYIESERFGGLKFKDKHDLTNKEIKIIKSEMKAYFKNRFHDEKYEGVKNYVFTTKKQEEEKEKRDKYVIKELKRKEKDVILKKLPELILNVMNTWREGNQDNWYGYESLLNGVLQDCPSATINDLKEVVGIMYNQNIIEYKPCRTNSYTLSGMGYFIV